MKGRRVLVGSERLFIEAGAAADEIRAAVEDLQSRGGTVVLVGVGAADDAMDIGAEGPGPSERTASPIEVIGALHLTDRVRPRAAAALASLRRLGVRHIAVLTGDNTASARAVAEACGNAITDVQAELLPEDKVNAVRALRDTHGPVLMVGDGINDAPALAAADVGVAMGAAGTDVALETADIALLADDLAMLPVLLALARKAARIIRVNIFFALAVKAVFVVLAVAGLATLWMAVLADMGASLLVIANGMRALRAPWLRMHRL